MKNLTSFKTAKILYKFGELTFKTLIFFQSIILQRTFQKNDLTKSGWHTKLAVENLELSEQMRKVEWSNKNRCKLQNNEFKLIEEDIYPLA
tara:strand:+ start:301 stop:573 length:273 start_codon:yes stop_codon:yes gene_type:complete